MNESPIDVVLHPLKQPYTEEQSPKPPSPQPPSRWRAMRSMSLLALLFTVMLATTAACPLYGQHHSGQCPHYPSPHLRMGFNVAKEGVFRSMIMMLASCLPVGITTITSNASHRIQPA